MKSPCAILSFLCLSLPSLSAAEPEGPAKFQITDHVIQSDPGAFAATLGPVGTPGLMKAASGFEPIQFRSKLQATADAPNRVVVDWQTLSQFDTLREGLLDGADVMIFRVVQGKMVLVRRDKVSPGGHAASGWNIQSGANKLLPPDRTEFAGGFEEWNRRGVPYWFTVVAVDSMGRESAPAGAVRIELPENAAKPGAKPVPLVDFPAPKRIPEGSGPAAPANLRGAFDPAAGNVRLSWEPVRGEDIAGYRIKRSDFDPAAHRGFFLDLTGKAGTPEEEIKNGDMVIVSKPFYRVSRKNQLTNRVFDSKEKNRIFPDLPGFASDDDPDSAWEFEKHPCGATVENAGETCLRLDLKGDSERTIQRYAYGATGQTWYPVLDPDKEYIFEIWMKQKDMPHPTVTFSLDGPFKSSVPALEFEVGAEWKKYTGTIKVPQRLEGGKGTVGQYVLKFCGPGTLWLDNFRFFEKGSDFLDLSSEDYAALKESGVSALRTHGFVKTGFNSYSIDQLTNPAGAINGTNGNTLPQTLAIMKKAGVRPWLQIEFSMSPEEWRGLVEYLAAPYDPAKDSPQSKPWAAKRHTQGQAKPWTEEFDRIYFELSNETWNRIFAPWTFQDMIDQPSGSKVDRGTAYGLFQEWVVDQLKSSPWWKEAGLDEKVEFVIGGWAVQGSETGYGARAATASPRSKYMTIAAYNGGWDEGEGPTEQTDAALQRILMNAPQVGETRSREFVATRDLLKKNGKADFQLGTYEAGPGYALSGLNNQAPMTDAEVEAQARSMKSLASGTATLDSFLEKAVNGFRLGNFFTFGRGRTHWTSHAKWYEGGQAFPVWKSLEMFNREGTGDFLEVNAESVPTMDMPGYKKRPAGNALPLVACYATKRPGRLNVFVLSRRLDKYPDPTQNGFTPVTLDLPITKASKVTVFRMTGDPRAHNLDREDIKVEKIELPGNLATPAFVINAATGADDRGLPPASTFLYIFEGAEFLR